MSYIKKTKLAISTCVTSMTVHEAFDQTPPLPPNHHNTLTRCHSTFPANDRIKMFNPTPPPKKKHSSFICARDFSVPFHPFIWSHCLMIPVACSLILLFVFSPIHLKIEINNEKKVCLLLGVDGGTYDIQSLTWDVTVFILFFRQLWYKWANICGVFVVPSPKVIYSSLLNLKGRLSRASELWILFSHLLSLSIPPSQSYLLFCLSPISLSRITQ